MKYPENLTQTEIEFLKHHKIAPSDLFDCHGITVKRFRDEMKESGRIVGYNSTFCNAGHKLKMRSGHCPVCKTLNIEMQKRSEKKGFIYIAYSKTGKIYQIGFTENYFEREKSLNYTGYGGFFDWKLELVIASPEAGRFKLKLKSKLKHFSVDEQYYFHENKKTEADDLYKLEFSEIYSVISKLLKSEDREVDLT